MPALVKRSVGSPTGTSEADGMARWPSSSKNVVHRRRISRESIPGSALAEALLHVDGDDLVGATAAAVLFREVQQVEFVEHVESGNDLAKDRVLVRQGRIIAIGDEELTAVAVAGGASHAHRAPCERRARRFFAHGV